MIIQLCEGSLQAIISRYQVLEFLHPLPPVCPAECVHCSKFSLVTPVSGFFGPASQRRQSGWDRLLLAFAHFANFVLIKVQDHIKCHNTLHCQTLAWAGHMVSLNTALLKNILKNIHEYFFPTLTSISILTKCYLAYLPFR